MAGSHPTFGPPDLRAIHSQPGHRKALIRLLKFFWWSSVAVICALVLGVSGAFLYLSPNLPSVDSLRSIQLQIPLRVYSSDGKLIAEFGEMRRSPIRFEEIPPQFIQALLSAEDDNFLNHYGVDPSARWLLPHKCQRRTKDGYNRRHRQPSIRLRLPKLSPAPPQVCCRRF